MVRPKMLAIKRELARCELNCGEVFHVRAILERIESRDARFFRLVRHDLAQFSGDSPESRPASGEQPAR